MSNKDPHNKSSIIDGIDVDALMKLVRDEELHANSDWDKGYKGPQTRYADVPIEKVVKNPSEYIIPELEEACKKLWSMNIFTYMCSNRCDGGDSFILLEPLSDENQAIFNKLMKEHPENFFYDKVREKLRIQFYTENLSEQKIAEMFDKAISYFKSQDVPKGFYLTKEQFLINCGCYKEVPNPKYVKNPGPFPASSNLKVQDKYFEKCNQPKMLKIFDETKVTKPFDAYLKENGITTYDPESQKIYRSEFCLKRHLDYVKKYGHSKNESGFTD